MFTNHSTWLRRRTYLSVVNFEAILRCFYSLAALVKSGTGNNSTHEIGLQAELEQKVLVRINPRNHHYYTMSRKHRT